MDTIIAYWSKTGHSRKIARHIGETLGLPVVDIRQQIPQAHTVVLISGIYAGKSDPKLLQAVRQMNPHSTQRIILILTCADPDAHNDDLRTVLAQKGLTVDAQGHMCPGGFLFIRCTRPNQKDLAQAADFVRNALNK
jgi:flavodoxin